MHDPHYPLIDLSFIEPLVLSNTKIHSEKIQVGETTAYVLKGDIALHKRYISIREIEPNKITFETATGLAIRLNFMGKLLTWLEQNKGWKDGAYCETIGPT